MTDIERFKSSVVEKWSHSTLSFISTLKLIHNIARLLKVGLVSEMDASKLLIRQVPLSHSNQQAIVEALAVDNLRWKQRKNMMETNTRSLRTWVDGHGNSVLHWSAFKNSTQSLSMLLNLGIDPNIKAEVSGWTPLHDAAYSDSSQSIELLIEAGANVNKPANSGATPLCFASQENSSHAIRTLLEAGADPTIRCCGGNQSENHHENMPITRFSGYTALHYAAHYNSEKAAKILLEYSAAYKCNLLEIPDLNDKLPIHVAVQRGSSDVLRELLHAGARVQTIEFSSQVANDITTGSRRGSPTYRSPPSSPLLRSMIPTRPVSSTKAWNCVSQRSIDECRILINEVEGNWSPSRHPLFYPSDREAVLELLRVGKHLEQRGTGIFLDLWPLVLSFCGRGWFDPSSNGSRTTQENDSNEQESNELNNFQL
jgi:ankyrin repeat protein